MNLMNQKNDYTNKKQIDKRNKDNGRTVFSNCILKALRINGINGSSLELVYESYLSRLIEKTVYRVIKGIMRGWRSLRGIGSQIQLSIINLFLSS